MSTKWSICYDPDKFHLYIEMLNRELTGEGLTLELCGDNLKFNTSTKSITVHIPKDVAKQIFSKEVIKKFEEILH